jgi:hypothetical protein
MTKRLFGGWHLVAYLGIALGVLRVAGLRSESFQAAAHLYVGAMLVEWLRYHERPAKWLVIILSAVEVATAVSQLLTRAS